MAYANSPEKVSALREIVPPRREANGRFQREKTRGGREQEREARESESEEEAMRVALGQPHRRNIPKHRHEDGKRIDNHPRDPRAGYALGRLYLHGQIDRDQLGAGQRYVELALRHMHHITGHLPKFPSQAINDTVKGLDCSADMPDEKAMELRRAWSEAQRALADTCEWQACASALVSIGIMDREPRSVTEMGSLRVGLNALHRLWT